MDLEKAKQLDVRAEEACNSAQGDGLEQYGFTLSVAKDATLGRAKEVQLSFSGPTEFDASRFPPKELGEYAAICVFSGDLSKISSGHGHHMVIYVAGPTNSAVIGGW